MTLSPSLSTTDLTDRLPDWRYTHSCWFRKHKLMGKQTLTHHRKMKTMSWKTPVMIHCGFITTRDSIMFILTFWLNLRTDACHRACVQWRTWFVSSHKAVVHTSDIRFCLLGDDGWGLVPRSVRAPRSRNRGGSFSKSHWGSALPPGSHHNTQLESGDPTEGMTGLLIHVQHAHHCLIYVSSVNIYCMLLISVPWPQTNTASWLYWWYVVTAVKPLVFFCCQDCIPQYYQGHFRRVGGYWLTHYI